MAAGSVERWRIRVRGTVQGVGFRPFVYRRAVALQLSGRVGNDGEGVIVDVEGPRETLTALLHAVRLQAPALALVEQVAVERIPVTGDREFVIAPTVTGAGTDVRVSADVAPCEACLRELGDADDRRFGYPFLNCTDCGPRYTIVRNVPYDRASTTMSDFALCVRCQQEYDDPADRRFHAQPTACPDCGPRLWWREEQGNAEGTTALEAAARVLGSGGVLAVKGVGGYHLACYAGNERALTLLRRRKSRPDKPFAVMVGDLSAAEQLCVLSSSARTALTSLRRPIVLAPRRPHAPVAPGVAPGLPELGVALPSSPLHVLLLAAVRRPLVMTSGNRSGEPLVHDDAETLDVLGPLVDGVLGHDRPIHVGVDDSVLRSAPSGRLQMTRRARGWVPQPVRLAVASPHPVLAVGAQLKSTVALARGNSLTVSQHLGDLDDWPTYGAFTSAIRHLIRLSGVRPTVVAHDLHPDYRSTAWAQESGLPRIGVQHHHAHVAACLVEHGITTKVLGIAFDGTGLGTDGTLWGGEFLLADLLGFERVGHLLPLQQPGGDAAVREPWRMALSWLHRALGPDVAAEHGARLDRRWAAVLSLVASGRSPETSSAGRLFDAAAALLGLRSTVSYEGQAAIELEACARKTSASRTPQWDVELQGSVLDPAPLLLGLVDGRSRGLGVDVLAAAFHRGLASGTARLAVDLAELHDVDTVALSGGVFQNVVFSDLLADHLRRAGLRVLLHEHLPPNDGSISVGQAGVAAARLAT